MTRKETDNRKIYSLLEISAGIRIAIAEAIPSYLWIKAEIARLNFYPKSGHCYPDLVEKQNGVIKAQIRANIWSGQFNKINQKFKSVTGEPLKDGLKILFLARVGYHEQYGMALNIIDIEPSFSLGEMAREKQATIARLKEEGFFDKNKRCPFPLLPKRVAVISVETSKGFSDFINVIQNNNWNYKFSLRLFPALLQGDGAVRSIGQQLKEIEERRDKFDVVAIIRGGGGDVGLNAYDSYNLSRAVAIFPLPVITGIGHSTNETVVQMVAFANKITPTEAGHFLIQQFNNFSVRLEAVERQITRLPGLSLMNEKQKLNNSLRLFEIHSGNFLNREEVKLNLLLKNLEKSSVACLQQADIRLKNISSGLFVKPIQNLRNNQGQVNNISRLINIHAKHGFLVSTNKLQYLENKLNLLKPENVLKRGYSVTYYNGKALTETSALQSGTTLYTKLYRGSLEVKVERVNKH